jgi:hypothetical protein
MLEDFFACEARETVEEFKRIRPPATRIFFDRSKIFWQKRARFATKRERISSPITCAKSREFVVTIGS